MSQSLFSINARSCTLKNNNQLNGGTILDGSHYQIPVFQRPYSWTEEEVRKFINDIFFSYWGYDKVKKPDSMFIGTMQLTEKRNGQYEVIDGQQRLTTILLFLKVLKQWFPQNSTLSEISLDWLHTRVHNGVQETYLQEALTAPINTTEDSKTNHYKNTVILLNDLLKEHLFYDSGPDFEPNDFINYLLSHIYFVIIETRAGLSKTLQIFDAINTTGLDLNIGDIVKIRLYEYLQKYEGSGEEAFNQINALYALVDEENKKLTSTIRFQDILALYQLILIAKYNLPVALYEYSVDAFYNILFDFLLHGTQPDHFKFTTSPVLDLKNLEGLINARFRWEKEAYPTAEDSCAMHFIWWSRYSRFDKLVFIFLFRYALEENVWIHLFQFTRQLSKLALIYSIRFAKSIYEIRIRFTHELLQIVLASSMEEALRFVNAKIGTLDNHKDWYDLENIIEGPITDNRKKKDLVCRLSAMLSEDFKSQAPDDIEIITQKLFSRDYPIDIEHIQPYNDHDGNLRQDIWKKWGPTINSIGNLVVLESSINRRISNNPFLLKKDYYAQSTYNAVTTLSTRDEWTFEDCQARQIEEKEKILNFLFED